MAKTVIKVENVSKQYRLGSVSTGTISHDVNRWWHRVRGKEDPYLKIGDVNDRSQRADSDYVWALRDVSFEVKQGEVLGIIGRNGAGKSTLLKILSRTTAPTTGSIKIRGRVASLLEVGTGFHPELTGRENVFLNGAILGMTRQEISRKFDEIVDFAGVERYIDTPVKRYSSGMYVRLAFAVAAFLEPEILIVDEVLAVGDTEFQKKCLGRMNDVSNKEGRTVLFVSHNMAAVKELCLNGIALKNGILYQKADINTIINSYLLQSGSESSYYAESDIRNKSGQFISIRLFNEQGKEANIFLGGTAPYIEIQYQLVNDYKSFNVGMVITDALENHIYSTADTDLEPDLLYFRGKGFYKVKSSLVLHNLNTGNYKIRFLMGIINRELFDKVELNFSIEHNNFLDAGVRPGLLLSMNKWDYFN